MRLAFLSDVILPYSQGGGETILHQRSTRLAQRGHTVTMYTLHWWPGRGRKRVEEGVELRAIMPRISLYTRAGRRSILEAALFGLASLRLMASEPFDALDVNQFPLVQVFAARLVCWLRRRPMTVTFHEVWDAPYWRDYIGWLAPVGLWLQRTLAHWADFVFADSELTASRVITKLGVSPERVVVLRPCGVETLPPAPSNRPPTYDCIVVGRLLPHKHVDIAIEAVARLQNVTCLVLGTGPEAQRLRALAAHLGAGDRIHFDAVATPADVFPRLRAARLMLFPSTREGFGIAVWEANACGIPAVVVRHPDNAALEIIEDRVNGYVCDLDPGQIATVIREYLADPVREAAMRKAALAAAARYSWESHVDRLEAAIRALVTPASSQAAAA